MTGSRSPIKIRVEVIYASPHRQALVAVEMEEDGTVEEAIRRSGILAEFPEIDIPHAKVGIFGRLVSPGFRVRDGDRVEIYRPLIVEPKQGRRMRAQQAQQRPRRR